MGGTESTVRFIAIFLIVLAAVPSIVLADARQFIPKITDYSGFLELDSIYESNENSVGGRSTTTKDLFLREKLDVGAVGYVYDPRFIVFSLRLSGGIKEEDYSVGPAHTPFSTMAAEEYEFRAMILPEHPYNLELFTLRLEPLSRGVFSSQSQSVAYSSGAVFRYKKKPYFLDVHYLDNTNESTFTSYTTTQYGMLGTYYKELVGGDNYSFTAYYDHQTSGSSDITSTSDDAALGNAVSFKYFSVSSDLIFHRTGQGSGVQVVSLSDQGISWAERGHIHLPWNLSADLSYDLVKDSIDIREASVAETKISDTTHDASLSITHKLYESLLSTYNMAYSSLRSDTGDSNTFSKSLAIAYTKKIPGGRLRSTFSVGSSDTESEGTQSIANEPHSGVSVPGHFTLNGEGVNIATIIVWLKSPDVPGELLLLAQNINYVIMPFGNTFQIDVLSLPPQFAVPGTYDFVVSYSMNSQNAKFRTTNLNYSVRLDLFGDMFVPYYNHNESRQTVLAGSTDFVPFDLSSDTYGFLFTRRPFSVTAEYAVVRSNINPSRGWKAEVDYVDNVLTNTAVTATAQYSSTFYPQGTSGTTGVSYTDDLLGVSAGVQQRIPKRNMFIYLGGAYSQEKGLANSTTYALTSSFTWAVGKIFINAGATASLADSEIEGITSKRVNQNYYLSVRRKLF